MAEWRSGIGKHFLDEVKPELAVKGRKGVSQTKGIGNHHSQKCRVVRLWRAALSGQRVRQEGGATDTGRP